MKTLHKFFATTLLIISINSVGQNLMSSNSTNEGGAIELINPLKTANNTANKWIFYNMTGLYGNSLQFWNYGNNGFYGSRFTILDNGYVGIGTTAPSEKLTVDGNEYITGNLFVGKDTETAMIAGQRNGGAIQIKSHSGLGGAQNRYLRLGWKDNASNFAPVLSINDDLNVGIGTTTPDSKLTVNGNIHAKEVKIDLTVPADYVFQKYYSGKSELKPDYTLLTLPEIEKFTQANHHLPNVPSAKEIKENGLHLGEMSNILLQKIEKLEKENQVFKSIAERLSKIEKELEAKK